MTCRLSIDRLCRALAAGRCLTLVLLAPLGICSAAGAQPAPAPDAPTTTAPRIPPPGAAGSQETAASATAPPIARTDDAPAADPDTRPVLPAKREQVFISPMGEPFRAPFGQPYPVQIWFARVDSDHDGSISREEFRADSIRFFDQLDANHDGVIDGFEVQDYEAHVAPEILPQVNDGLSAQDVMTQRELSKTGHRQRRAEDSFGSKGRGGAAMTGAALFGLLVEPEPVRGADANLDFRITRAEWLAAAERRFGRLDTERAGKLTLAGLPQTPFQKALAEQARVREKGGAHRRGGADG